MKEHIYGGPHSTIPEISALALKKILHINHFLRLLWFHQVHVPSVQFSSVAQSCPTLCNPMNRSTPGLPVHHHLPELTQTHVHRVRDAIQPSHPRSTPSPPAPNPSQHQSLFQWVNSSHEVAQVLCIINDLLSIYVDILELIFNYCMWVSGFGQETSGQWSLRIVTWKWTCFLLWSLTQKWYRDPPGFFL